MNVIYVYTHEHYLRMYVLEMQQYIDISPYCDTLGSDTVSMHIYVVSIYRIS